MNRTNLQGRFYPGDPAPHHAGVTAHDHTAAAGTTVQTGGLLPVLAALLVLAATTRLCAAAEPAGSTAGRGSKTEAGDLAGPIQDPLHAQGYMRDLATRLDSSDVKATLLRGVSASKTAPASGVSASRAPAAARPSAAPSAGSAARPNPQPTTPAPTHPADAGPPLRTFTLVPQGAAMPPGFTACPSPKPTDKPEPKAAPAAAGPKLTSNLPAGKPESQAAPAPNERKLVNGLSAENHAAQRVLQDLNMLPREQPPALSRAVNPVPAYGAGRLTKPVLNTEILGAVGEELMSAQSGLTVWTDRGLAAGTTPAYANWNQPTALPGSPGTRPQGDSPGAALAGSETTGAELPKWPQPPVEKPWSLGTDLDKYRAHAVTEGSRDSGENLKKAFARAGLALSDSANVFVLGYGSSRGKPFRANDGKSLLDEPGKVPQQAGTTLATAGEGLYSLADLATLNALPDPNHDAYKDNHPVVRPLLFAGRAIGGVWKTTEEVGNAVTWGLFDNVTGCIGQVIEDLLELLKHTGEAATNVVRAPVHLVAGKQEGVEKTMDWVLLVPLEFVSNSAQMKGFSNMQDYRTAFADKGVIGSVLELGGSTFLAYRAVDELADRLQDKHHGQTTNDNTTPVDNQTEPPIPDPGPSGWPDGYSGIYYDGPSLNPPSGTWYTTPGGINVVPQ